MIDRLEDKGWLRREADPADRRSKRVYLTEEVKPAMRSLRRIAADFRSDALDGLNQKQREQFVDTLIDIKANLLSLQVNGESQPRSRNRG